VGTEGEAPVPAGQYFCGSYRRSGHTQHVEAVRGHVSDYNRIKGLENLRQYTYCANHCSGKHRLRRLFCYPYFYLFIILYLAFYLIYLRVPY
jgi:hypothetical protein